LKTLRAKRSSLAVAVAAIRAPATVRALPYEIRTLIG
jgi:hypothetical protein